MKRRAWLLAINIGVLVGCHGSAPGEARPNTDAIARATRANHPGMVATSTSGCVLRAMVDGNPWQAEGMLAFNASNDDFALGNGGGIETAFYIDRFRVAPRFVG